MVHGENRIPFWIDRRLTGLAGPDYAATISFGLPYEPEDSQYGESRLSNVERKRHVTTMTEPQLRDRATAVVIRDGKVLLVLGRGPVYMMPGGRIEQRESAAEAVARELFEETGLTATQTDYLFIVETATNRHHVFLIDSTGEVDIGNTPDGETIGGYLWWDRQEAIEAFGHVEAILERL